MIAVGNHGDGFGSNMDAHTRALAVARHECKYFKFNPPTYMEHLYAAGINTKEMLNFSGLRSDPEVTRGMKLRYMDIFGLMRYMTLPSDVYYTPNLRAELHSMYFSTPKPSPCPYDLAIHIRRGDVTPTMGDGVQRWLADEVYEYLITDWLAHSPDAQIGIYSEGTAHDFSGITRGRPQVHLVLNGDPQVAFHHFVTARALSVGPSTFSMVPGHMNSNTVFFLARPNDWRTHIMNHSGVRIVPLFDNRAQWPSDMQWM